MQVGKITRSERLKLLRNLPYGAQTQIAKKFNVTVQHVHHVLRGLRSDNHGIIVSAIALAEASKKEKTQRAMVIRERIKRL